MEAEPQRLEALIKAVPNPVVDRDALIALRDPEDPAACALARRLHVEDAWRQSPLRELLPGLTIVSTPLHPRLSVRAAKGLARADIQSWAALADRSPSALFSLSGIGAEAVEEVLLAACGEWAAAYLRAADDRKEQAQDSHGGSERLLRVLGRAPDPAVDGELLELLRNPEDPDASWLIERLHTDDTLRFSPLRDLLPGLGLGESSAFSLRLSVRAANALGRADADTLSALAGLAPTEILALPDVGTKTGVEILGLAVSEWAASYVGQVEANRSNHPESDAATVVSDAKRRADLIQAFAGIEMPAAFEVFRLRQLEPDQSLTQAQVAEKLGISPARVAQNESSVQTMLSKQMHDKDSPLATAVDGLRDRLGAVARPADLDEGLGAIDLAGDVLPESMPQRRALLLWLADLRLSAEWVLDPEIESITKVVLRGLTESGPADLDTVGRQLTRLGVRESLQLPWIMSQFGFRIVNSKLVRTDEE